MYNNFNIQELIALITFSILLLVALIALFNFDWLNNAISQFYGAIEKKHSKTNSGLGRFILAFYKYPGKLPQGIEDDGWKCGITVLSLVVSTLLFGGGVLTIGVNFYYGVIALLRVLPLNYLGPLDFVIGVLIILGLAVFVIKYIVNPVVSLLRKLLRI